MMQTRTTFALAILSTAAHASPVLEGLTSTVIFKLLPSQDDHESAAASVAARAGLGAPRRTFRPAGTNEEKHVAAGLHLWYEAEPIAVTRRSSASVNSIVAAQAALSRIPVVAHNTVASSSQAASSSTVSVSAAQIRPSAQKTETPNDPGFSSQEHFTSIGMEAAWELTAGSPSVVVAVVDSGMDMTHSDLTNRWVNHGEICDDGIDNDSNGFVDDCYGYNFADDTGNLLLEGDGDHGTHCAGIVGANSDNQKGVAGTAGGKDGAPGVSLMTLTTFGKNSVGGFAEAIVYGADNGASISSNSWGYTSAGAYGQDELDAIDYFNSNANGGSISDGGIVVFAAGNDASSGDWYPGVYPGAYAVAAVDDSHAPASFTNFGDWIDVSAPGVAIYSTVFERAGGYASYSGTSMACPMVSGALALLVSYRPGFTRAEYTNCLESTASAVSSTSPSDFGAGVISPAAALECIGQLEGSPMPPPAPAPPPLPPSPPPAPPGFTIVSGAQYCEVTNGGLCVTDGTGNYGDNEACVVRADATMTVTATEFDVESHSSCSYDSLTIGGSQYCGSVGPQGVTMEAGSTMTWSTDFSVNAAGFVVCSAGAAAPASPADRKSVV